MQPSLIRRRPAIVKLWVQILRVFCNAHSMKVLIWGQGFVFLEKSTKNLKICHDSSRQTWPLYPFPSPLCLYGWWPFSVWLLVIESHFSSWKTKNAAVTKQKMTFNNLELHREEGSYEYFSKFYLIKTFVASVIWVISKCLCEHKLCYVKVFCSYWVKICTGTQFAFICYRFVYWCC